MHALDALDPVDATYHPAAQSVQSSVDAAEYLPVVQGVQVVPPLADNVFVTEPAAHTAHATVDSAEY
jgi:hypothetical protein